MVVCAWVWRARVCGGVCEVAVVVSAGWGGHARERHCRAVAAPMPRQYRAKAAPLPRRAVDRQRPSCDWRAGASEVRTFSKHLHVHATRASSIRGLFEFTPQRPPRATSLAAGARKPAGRQSAVCVISEERWVCSYVSN